MLISVIYLTGPGVLRINLLCFKFEVGEIEVSGKRVGSRFTEGRQLFRSVRGQCVDTVFIVRDKQE